MHISDKAEIVFMTRGLTDGLIPFFNGTKNESLDTRIAHWWTLWETLDELIKEFLTRDLEMEGVTTILDENV